MGSPSSYLRMVCNYARHGCEVRSRVRHKHFLTNDLGASLSGKRRTRVIGGPSAAWRPGDRSETWATQQAACGRWPSLWAGMTAFGLLALAPGETAKAADFAAAGNAATDKSQYTLFNPTPERLLREFGTDRPDLTESPFSEDAGHIQFESNLFGFTRSRPDTDGTVTDTYGFGETN